MCDFKHISLLVVVVYFFLTYCDRLFAVLRYVLVLDDYVWFFIVQANCANTKICIFFFRFDKI